MKDVLQEAIERVKKANAELLALSNKGLLDSDETERLVSEYDKAYKAIAAHQEALISEALITNATIKVRDLLTCKPAGDFKQ